MAIDFTSNKLITTDGKKIDILSTSNPLAIDNSYPSNFFEIPLAIGTYQFQIKNGFKFEINITKIEPYYYSVPNDKIVTFGGYLRDIDNNIIATLYHASTRTTSSMFNEPLVNSQVAKGCRVCIGVNNNDYYLYWTNVSSTYAPSRMVRIFDTRLNNYINEESYAQVFPFNDSNSGGATGSGDNTSNIIDFPSLPTIDIIDTNMVTMYKCTPSQLSQLASFLWSDSFVDTIKKNQSSPLDSIISLHTIPNFPTQYLTDKNIIVGNVDSSVLSNALSRQYVEFDCGEISINEYWGSYADYTPYTNIEIYLPFCGVSSLKVSEVMGATIHLRYIIDLACGKCVALLKVKKENVDAVLYSFDGNCGVQSPLNARDCSEYWKSQINGIVGGVALLGSVALAPFTGGASLALGATAIGGASALGDGAISNIAKNQFNIAKESINRTGSITSTSGMMNVKTPFVVINRPILSSPKNYRKYNGYNSNITMKLGDADGFTKVKYINMDNVPCSEKESFEIKQLLFNGVIV